MTRNHARVPPAALLCACLLALLPGPVFAQEPARYALIFGNSHYEGGAWLALASPAQDAQVIAKALRSVGFEIAGCSGGVCLDATRATMDSAIREFGSRLAAHPGALAFVYYSGHGVQARHSLDSPGENFLVPIGSGVKEDTEVASRAVPLQHVMDVISGAGAHAGIVVLDACRTNGLRRADTASNIIGLAPGGGGGMLIAYAAQPGHVGLDRASGDSAPISPYAQRLAGQLVIPGKSIVDVFLDAGAEVAADTSGLQKPETVIRLSSNLYLAGGASPHDPMISPPRPVAQTGSTAAGAAGEMSRASYAMGLQFGHQMLTAGLSSTTVSLEDVKEGLSDGLAAVTPSTGQLQQVAGYVRGLRDTVGAQNRAKADAFLAGNGRKPDVVTTASGLQYRVLSPGTGATPALTDTVTVNYTGRLLDGTEFDGTDRHGGQPAHFPVGGVIKGFTEALLLMKPGARFQVFIPPGLAYDMNVPPGAAIPPGSLLVFDIELLSITQGN
jgi:FKBP-type peptidyl-prolyl cis-trans isomerase